MVAETLSSIYTEPEAEPQTLCALCQLPASRHIEATLEGQTLSFCCYGCRHIYEIVAPDLAQGIGLAEAMGQAGLDLNAPCCRGAIYGDPQELSQNILSRLMLNSFLAMMVMVLSLALYSDFFFSEWGEIGQSTRSFLQVIAMLFATPAVLMLAIPILEEAVFTWQIYRRLTTSALIAGGSLAAYGLSVYATFVGQGHTYFETATMILLLVTLGRWLDIKAQVDGSHALTELLNRAPVEANVLSATGDEILTPLEALRLGDQIRVRPGESFAVDGRVVAGQGSVNEANITGESKPAFKGIGDVVYAGTHNLDGSLVIETTHVGEERVMGKLVRLLDEARLHRAPIERLADQVAAYFVPTVIVLATATFLYWSWQVSFERGLLNSLAVLLIACPCALGIATPLAIWAALGRAAQAGILIRDSLTLEKLSRVRQVFFDKTGTLTTGQPTLTEIIQSSSQIEAQHVLQIAASLEYHTDHPLAEAIAIAAAEQNITVLPVLDFQAIPGYGLKGKIDGQMIYLGSWRLVEQQALELNAHLAKRREELERQGVTLVYFGWAGQVQALFAFSETIRPNAATILQHLRDHKREAHVLTGDSEVAGTALGERLGVAVTSELLPHDKLALVEQAETKGPVVMVGDGLNDAPALARASVGVALGCGADVTRETADVSLLGSDLAQIDWTLTLAQRTYNTITWNLLWAFLYNVIGVALAMAGLLHPILAATAMVLSSALVVINSLRIFKFSAK